MKEQKLILVRGIPGSGKSTIAKDMLKLGYADSHFETDMYFVNNGKYVFNAKKLQYAHEWCLEITRHHLLSYGETVVVSNTFTQKWEAANYIAIAKENKIKIEIVTCNHEYGSVHNVPEETLKKMRGRFVTDTSDWI